MQAGQLRSFGPEAKSLRTFAFDGHAATDDSRFAQGQFFVVQQPFPVVFETPKGTVGTVVGDDELVAAPFNSGVTP